MSKKSGKRPYVYEPKHVDAIVIRQFAFDFPEDLDPKWVPGRVERSFLFNGFSLTMPYLEPYLIKTMQEAAKHIDDPDVLADMRGFNGQEARHYECHERLNRLLKANGYPELEDVERRCATAFERLSKRSLRTRLAYNAGFESMTNGFTKWFIDKRTTLFKHAQRHVSSFWIMHMVEETEHKTVAFDAYMSYSGAWMPRAFGVFHGSSHVLFYGIVGMITALRKDGILWRPGTVWNMLRELGSLAWNVGPFLLRATLPGFNPRQDTDPQWMKDWVAGHARLERGALLPLVDTDDPEMPVPFPAAAES